MLIQSGHSNNKCHLKGEGTKLPGVLFVVFNCNFMDFGSKKSSFWMLDD